MDQFGQAPEVSQPDAAYKLGNRLRRSTWVGGGEAHRNNLTNAKDSNFFPSSERVVHSTSLINLIKSSLSYLAKDSESRQREMKPERFQGRRRRYSSSSVDSLGSYGSADSDSTESIPQQFSPRRGRSSTFSRNHTVSRGDDHRRRYEKEPYSPREYRNIRSWDVSKLQSELEALGAFCNTIEQNGQLPYPFVTTDQIQSNIRMVFKECVSLAHDKRAEDREERLHLHRGLSDQLYRLLTLVVIERERDCTVCGEKKRSVRFPEFISRRCSHSVRVCKTCIRNWTAAQLDSVGWNRIRCPECPEIIEKDELKEHASRDTYER